MLNMEFSPGRTALNPSEPEHSTTTPEHPIVGRKPSDRLRVSSCRYAYDTMSIPLASRPANSPLQRHEGAAVNDPTTNPGGAE